MRVAVVSTQFIRVPPGGYGGTELFCGDLACALVERGHQVTLFATGDSESSAELAWIFPRASWPPSDENERTHVRWALERIASSESPYDAVQVNSPYALEVAEELHLSVVYTIHHVCERALSTFYAAHGASTQYVCISRRQLQLEVPLPHVTVIHHGLEVSRYPLSLRSRGYVLHIGRFCEQKGTHLAIDAARRAGVPIVIAGRYHDQDERYFHTEVLPRLSDGGVAFCGEADHARKVALLGGAQALLCPIQWEEPFGLAPVESMLCGTPVIGYARGSFPEIVDEGTTGLLPLTFDAMVEAIRAVDRLDRTACARRARARFSALRMAAAYEHVFQMQSAGAPPVRASGG